MKKILVFILAVAVLCSIAVGTTLTYFTDTDYDTNTMTVGKVGINQTINGQETGIASYALFPVTAEPDAITGLVPVENNGVNMDVIVSVDSDSQNAYVRTIFAFEMKKVGNTWVSPIGTDVILVQSGITMTGVTFVKDDIPYIVGVCDYAGALQNAGATLPSLKQVYLASTVGNEFSTAVDGQYNILVLSQAVQTQGFTSADAALTAAFGEVNATNVANWFK